MSKVKAKMNYYKFHHNRLKILTLLVSKIQQYYLIMNVLLRFNFNSVSMYKCYKIRQFWKSWKQSFSKEILSSLRLFKNLKKVSYCSINIKKIAFIIRPYLISCTSKNWNCSSKRIRNNKMKFMSWDLKINNY